MIVVCACVHVQSLSCVRLCDAMDCSQKSSSVHRILQAKNTRVGCCFLLQGIFQTQRSNPCLLYLLHWQADCLPLSPLESNWLSTCGIERALTGSVREKRYIDIKLTSKIRKWNCVFRLNNFSSHFYLFILDR